MRNQHLYRQLLLKIKTVLWVSLTFLLLFCFHPCWIEFVYIFYKSRGRGGERINLSWSRSHFSTSHRSKDFVFFTFIKTNVSTHSTLLCALTQTFTVNSMYCFLLLLYFIVRCVACPHIVRAKEKKNIGNQNWNEFHLSILDNARCTFKCSKAQWKLRNAYFQMESSKSSYYECNNDVLIISLHDILYTHIYTFCLDIKQLLFISFTFSSLVYFSVSVLIKFFLFIFFYSRATVFFLLMKVI